MLLPRPGRLLVVLAGRLRCGRPELLEVRGGRARLHAGRQVAACVVRRGPGRVQPPGEPAAGAPPAAARRVARGY